MKKITDNVLKKFCLELESTPDYNEVQEAMDSGEEDFEVQGVRFIKKQAIDRIQQEELSSDLYTLGCFHAWFISEVTGIDIEAIEAMQAAECFEGIGKLIISLGKLEDLQKRYSEGGGYGHHFNSYDGSEEEVLNYHVFDTRG